MKDSLNTLKELASSVRNATKEGENSAERIGRLFEGILEYIKTPESIENYFELKQDSNGLDYIYTKYNIASAGALSMYASDKINVPSIYDGLPIDNDTIYWHEVDGSKVLKAKGGGGEAGSVQWDNISGKPSWIEDTKPSYSWSDITGEKPFYTKEEIASKYVTIDTEQEITALKHFTAGLSVGESKKKIYEENGVVYIDADVAVTGAMTFYASAGRSVSTIMDGVTVDEETITKGSDNVLRIKNAGAGSSFDENAMWSALSGSSDNQINKSHLTTALTGYATESWVTSKNYAVKATTLAGYGITDGVNDVSVTGTGNAVTDASVKGHILTLTKGSTFSLSGHKHAWADITSGKPTTLSGYGITDAYTMTESDNKYPTKTGSGASGTWGINVTGNAGTATKLQTARTLWGRSFDGTGNVSGNLDSVGNIILNRNAIIKGSIGGSDFWKIYTKEIGTSKSDFIIEVGDDMDERILCRQTRWNEDRPPREITLMGYSGEQRFIDVYINGIRLHKTADGVLTLEGNLAVTGGITTYAIDPVSVSTVMDGVVVDGTTIKKENGKLVAVGGGEAGSVQWENISGKPSVYATNIANITDLHSSWDAVLKSQKPNWLTAVSIATISDLHANWDALLKAAPSAYVTRWPTISEVTGKQNLVVKLNGGTTEGTNQFTYNATGAKTINITPAGIGAYTKSESDSKYPTKTGSGASGTWGIGITGNAATASKWATARTITLGSYLSGSVSLDGSANVTLNANVIGLTSQGKKAAVSGTTFQEVGVRLYEVFENGYPTNYGNLLSVRGGGCGELLLAWKDQYSRIYYRSKADSGNDSWTNWNTVAFLTDNIASATKLQTARTLWGQSFNGEKNVSGNLSNVGNIVPSSDNTYTLGNATNHFEGAYVRVLRNNINREMIIAQNAANNLVFQTSGVNRVIISSDGNLRMGDSFIISEATQDTTYRVRIKTESYNPYISFNQSGNTWFVQGYNNKLYLGSTSAKSINIDSEGNLYSPQNITASKVVSAAAFKGNRIRIECNDAGTPDVRRSEINNFQANLYLQHATSNNLICCNGGGKVGIGTTSPSYKLHVNGNVAVNTGVNVYGMTGSSWGAGNGAYEIQIPNNSQQTPILLAYDINGGITGTSRYFSIEILNGSNRNVRMLVQGQHVIELLPSKVTILKDLLVEGGCTFYESDQRAKNIIGLVDLSLKQICEAPTIRFRWNGWHTKDDGRNHVGGIAQYIQGILPEAIINSDKTLSMDYATVAYTFAVHTARHLMNYETRTDKKIKKLEREIVILKKQLKKLGYEEVRTLDDQSV